METRLNSMWTCLHYGCTLVIRSGLCACININYICMHVCKAQTELLHLFFWLFHFFLCGAFVTSLTVASCLQFIVEFFHSCFRFILKETESVGEITNGSFCFRPAVLRLHMQEFYLPTAHTCVCNYACMLVNVRESVCVCTWEHGLSYSH